jgi:uncharacterized protein
MLLRFRFSNFRSFRDEQELSLIASSESSGTDGVLRSAGLAEGVLPVIAIYGANASGKTNVVRALQYMASVVQNSHSRWQPEQPIPCEPFRTEESMASPSTFVVDFLLNNVRHQYGFSTNSEVVLEEWLFAYPRGKKQAWLARKQRGRMVFSGKMLGDNKTIERLTRKNSLFLSAAAQNNHEMLLPIYNWFSASLSFVSGDRKLIWRRTDPLVTGPEYRDSVATLLSLADLGIDDISMQEVVVPDGVKKLMEGLTTFLRATVPDAPANALPSPDELQRHLRLHHRLGNSSVPFEQPQESGGTLALLTLLGWILPALRNGGTVCVDELESSLHPILAVELVRLFGDSQQNKQGAQLVFNTHEANLLNADVLRRDEIWFTEKQQDGASHLYPLTDFKPRRQENLENGYLQGRYGAIPFLRADRLVDFETRDEEG